MFRLITAWILEQSGIPVFSIQCICRYSSAR